jgi:hypothetical protein
VSAQPYEALNLGGHVGDDAELVAANRTKVAEALGVGAAQVLYMNQVHGADVAKVGQPWDGPAPDIDAMVTDRAGLVLAVLVADCVPVLLGDAASGVVGVAHAGRPGMVAGVVPAVVQAMQDVGARNISAWIGPAVCGQCYEVPAEMQTAVGEVVPDSLSTTRAGTPGIDIRAGVRAQLAAAGIADIDTVDVCTLEDPAFYSYRRDGRTGRLAGLVWLTG